jgi:hypothetical protein
VQAYFSPVKIGTGLTERLNLWLNTLPRFACAYLW